MTNLVILNMLRNKRRFLTGVGGIALAVALILLIEGFSVGMFRQNAAYVEKNGADIYLGQKGLDAFTMSMVPRTLESEIAAVGGVAKVSSLWDIQVILDLGERKTPAVIYGFQKVSGMGGPWKLAAGYMIAEDDEIILDQVLAKQNGLKLGDNVKVLGKDFKIVGLSAETNAFMNPAIFITERAATDRMSTDKVTNMFLIKADDSNQISALKLKLTEKFPDYSVITRRDFAEKFVSSLDQIMGAPLMVILVITFLVGLMTVSLTTHMNVLAKSKEYGILKAIGASNRTLYVTVLTEVLLWTVFGFGAAWGLSLLAARLIETGAPQFNISITSASLVKAGVMTAVISILSTLSPLRRVVSLDPAQVFNK